MTTTTKTMATASTGMAVAAALALAGCSGGPVPAVSTLAPPVSAAPPPAPSAPTAIQDWCAGTGYSDWQAVSNDVSQLRTDSGDGNLAATAADGSQLASAAEAAGVNLPPFARPHKLDYGLAMGWLAVSGSKVSNGDVSGAASALQTANGFLGDVGGLVSSDCPGG